LYEQLGLPLHASRYTPQLLANLEASLVSLAEAVDAEAVVVDDTGIHRKALEAEEPPLCLRRPSPRSSKPWA
jgi:hypothetical protein